MAIQLLIFLDIVFRWLGICEACETNVFASSAREKPTWFPCTSMRDLYEICNIFLASRETGASY